MCILQCIYFINPCYCFLLQRLWTTFLLWDRLSMISLYVLKLAERWSVIITEYWNGIFASVSFLWQFLFFAVSSKSYIQSATFCEIYAEVSCDGGVICLLLCNCSCTPLNGVVLWYDVVWKELGLEEGGGCGLSGGGRKIWESDGFVMDVIDNMCWCQLGGWKFWTKNAFEACKVLQCGNCKLF